MTAGRTPGFMIGSRDAFSTTAAEVVAVLGLVPHPEGGFYRETFRDVRVDASGRSYSTAIYFLLPEGVVSRWHRVDAVEVWHWYGGAPLELSVRDAESSGVSVTVMGGDFAGGEHPQAIVPAGAWQQARSFGAWTLVGCTVAPGFEFAGFEIADL